MPSSTKGVQDYLSWGARGSVGDQRDGHGDHDGGQHEQNKHRDVVRRRLTGFFGCPRGTSANRET